MLPLRDLALLLLVSFLFVAVVHDVLRRRRHSRPPGPPGRPLVGNLFDIPVDRPWETFMRWKREYGNVVQLDAPGVSIVVLNSADAVVELLDRRGAVYSDRPYSRMLCDLMGYGWGVNAMPYNECWRAHRRLLHHFLRKSAAQQLWSMQQSAAQNFARSLLSAPNDYWQHAKHFGASTATQSAYGMDIAPKDDWFVAEQERNIEYMTLGSTPLWLVDVFPALQYIPEWFPGARFQKIARAARDTWSTLLNVPFAQVKQDMAAGTAPPSLARDALTIENCDGIEGWQHEQYAKQAAGIVYIAGVDTTASVIHAFFLAMVMFPEAQRRAHDEIDQVTGGGRLPQFTDRANLPYVQALLSEVHRWMPVAPVGLPRRLTQDDTYLGYSIRKGSIVFANAWAILHDETMYPQPSEFRPERFMSSGDRVPDPDPADLGIYGFGRRICPGRWMADASVWIAMVTVLALFDVVPARDDSGKDIPVDHATAQLPSINSGPLPFTCNIRPRNQPLANFIWEDTR